MEGARKPGRKKKVKRGSQKSANIDPKLSKVERKRRMDQLRKSLTKGTEDEEISQRGGESSEESTQGETSQTDDTLSQDGECHPSPPPHHHHHNQHHQQDHHNDSKLMIFIRFWGRHGIDNTR